VVLPLIFLRPLHRHQIFRFLNNANDGRIPPFVLANMAGVDIGNIAAYGTIMRIPLYADERLRKIDHIVLFHPKDVKSKPGGRFRPDARQSGKGIN
jgi:hypothetical protein